jgi:hypothetical protein
MEVRRHMPCRMPYFQRRMIKIIKFILCGPAVLFMLFGLVRLLRAPVMLSRAAQTGGDPSYMYSYIAGALLAFVVGAAFAIVLWKSARKS